VSTPRRTQQERRETTIGLLVDATIATIAESGYAKASLGTICERSGVSRGGLFRHFDSRQDLMVAAAAEVAARHFASVEERIKESLTVLEAIHLLRERHRAIDNVVWFELMVAARTDHELRKRLADTTKRFLDQIIVVARRVLGAEMFADDEFALLVNTLEHTFDGETIRRELAPDPAAEDRRVELLAEFVEFLVERRSTSSP